MLNLGLAGGLGLGLGLGWGERGGADGGPGRTRPGVKNWVAGLAWAGGAKKSFPLSLILAKASNPEASNL